MKIMISFSPPPPPPPPRFVGAYPFLSPSLSYILEDGAGVCGYVLAALDSHDFYARFTAEWLPSVLPQYPQLLSAAADDGDTTSSDGGLSQQEQVSTVVLSSGLAF